MFGINKNRININILRMIAYLVDVVVFILLLIPFACVIVSIVPSNLADYAYTSYSFFCLVLGAYAIYYLVAWKSKHQRTLGQLFSGLRLLSTKESGLTYRQCLLKILILLLPPVLFIVLLTLETNALTKIKGEYLLCILYALLLIYWVLTWEIDSLMGLRIVRYYEIQQSSNFIRPKRICAYIIDLLISLKFCILLFFIFIFLLNLFPLDILKNSIASDDEGCPFVMPFNIFMIAYYFYHLISWKEGYRRTLGQLCMKLKVENINTEKRLSPNRSIKIFFLLLPILPLVIYFNYSHFIYDFGEGAQYLIPIVMIFGVITQIVCLGFADEIDCLSGMKITNSNKKELL